MHTYTKALRNTGLLISLLALAAVGCGSDDGAASASPGTGGAAAGGGSAASGGSSATGAGGESGGASCGPTDEPDADGTDDNCDGADGVVDSDVYVAGTGSDTNPGTPTAPFKTIDKALEVAQNRSGKVLVAAGDFDAVAIDRAGDHQIHGGYGAQFLGTRQASSTSLNAANPEGIVVSTASSVHFETLTITGVSAKDSGQRSAHALVLDVPQAKLVDVRVIARDALPGADGQSGTPGGAGKDGQQQQGAFGLTCNGNVQPNYAFGATAGQKNSAGGAAGSCPNKTPAAAGAAGIAGTDGANASALATFESGALLWPNAADAADDAKPGFGGAGGGTCELHNEAGGGGSGGCPGSPGTGAQSGGGSVAILILSGTLSVQRSTIRTGFGADGGNGGKGGLGGPGGIGGKPECPFNMDCSKITSQCQPATDPWQTNCARWGGAGGPGGSGGHGGGGVGGWSVGIVTLGAATAEFDPATVFELGSPGKGGEGPGGVRAANGEKRKQWALASGVN